MSLQAHSREQILLVGRLVLRAHPEIATKLLSAYNPQQGFRKDLNDLPRMFIRFCYHNKVTREEVLFKGNPKSVMLRRLFAGAVVSIFDPEALNSKYRIRQGVVKGIAGVLQVYPGNISKLIREAAIRRVYDDFNVRLEEIIELLKK